MSTNFPNSIDVFIKPSSSNKLNEVPHSALHGNEIDSIVALENYVGEISSSVTSSLTYRLNLLPNADFVSSSFVVLNSSTTLPNERVLTAGTNINFVDNGPGGTIVINADAISGSSGTSGGEVSASYLVLNATASLANERVLTAGQGISFVDGGAGGALTINATAVTSGDSSASYVVMGTTSSLANERVLVAADGITLFDGGAGNGVTMSLNRTLVDTFYAPSSASYLVLGLTGTLANERLFSTGSLLTVSDGGAGGNYVVNVNQPALTAALDTASTYVRQNSSAIFVSSPVGTGRQLAAGTNVTLTDGGAGSTITINAVTASDHITNAIHSKTRDYIFSDCPPTAYAGASHAVPRAYAKYLGFFPSGTIINQAHIYVTAVTASMITEIGIASSSNMPMMALPNLVVITSSTIPMTGSGTYVVKHTDTPFNYTSSVDQYLWGMIRFSSSTGGATTNQMSTAVVADYVGMYAHLYHNTYTGAFSASKNQDISSGFVDVGAFINIPNFYFTRF